MLLDWNVIKTSHKHVRIQHGHLLAFDIVETFHMRHIHKCLLPKTKFESKGDQPLELHE